MSTESNVILITNNNAVAQSLKPKLVLLRGIDNISTGTYADAIKDIRTYNPDTVLIHCSTEKDECIELIKKIKSDEKIKDSIILLVIDEYDADFALNAYDEGISDYLTLKDDDAEILMRTIWCLKKNSLVNTVQKQHSLLEQLQVMNKETDFYSAKYCDTVLENELKILEAHGVKGSIIAISPSSTGKTKLSGPQLANIIRKSTRNSDVVAHGVANKFFILLPKTNLQGALCVWDKIKQTTGDDTLVVASAAEIIGNTFENLKTELLNGLAKADSNNQEITLIGVEETPASDDWLEKINSNQKNFKLFKQAFSKKLEKVITPVFFQMQKLYEDKLFKTKIEQYSNSTLSCFSLKRLNRESELKITYPGFSKINIDIVHQGLDSPENKRINLDLSELDEAKLTEIIDEFINEFKNNAAN